MVFGNEEKIKLLGVTLDNVPEDDLETIILNLTQSEETKRAVILDFRSFMRERRKLKKGPSYLADADLVFTTSWVVARAVRKLYSVDSIRFYPFSLVVRILGILEKRNLSAYFLGGDSREIMKLTTNVRSSFPSLKIVGRYKGNYENQERESVLTGIKKAGANFLLVGSRIKRADLWVQTVSHHFRGLILTSPHAFNVLCGKEKVKTDIQWSKITRPPVKTIFLPWRWFRLFTYLKFWISVSWEKRKLKKTLDS